MGTIGDIEELRRKQLSFFSSGKTRDPIYIRSSLIKLERNIVLYENEISDALKKDLNKSAFESYATEVGLVLNELRTMIRNFRNWSRIKSVRTPLFAFPSSSYIYPEPFGRVLIMSPWNYPFQLPVVPLIGAVAAGNVVMLRQSRYAPATSEIIKKILGASFSEEHVATIDCSIECAEEVIKMRWDMIFFTGSTNIGRKIYEAAAAHLTPVILELGGKSPVIVDEDFPVKIAARRIIWGKVLNGGQSCVAPDHLFVHENIRDSLTAELKSAIISMYGADPLADDDYPKVISKKAFERLSGYLDKDKIIYGGRTNAEKQTIEPTLLDASVSDLCMKDEIFGPILPILTFRDLDEPINFINSREKPLALYFFSRDRNKQKRILRETSAGACLMNDVVIHFANKYLPYGGVGESGTGRFHGKESFRAFSNMKAVMKTSPRIEIPIKYPPFSKLQKRLIRFFMS
jgi:aldehyde dehydrogenase (NAD+)